MTSFLLPQEMPHRSAALRDARSDFAESRWIAAMALGQCEDPTGEAKTALLQLLNDEVPEVRAQAIEGLVSRSLLGETIATSFVSTALLDAAPCVRCAAVEAAAVLPDHPVEPIALRIRDEDPSVRAVAVCVVGDLELVRHGDLASTLLDDPDPRVGFEAAVALSKLGDDRGVPVLIENLHRRSTDAVEAALALGRLGRPGAQETLRKITTRPFVSTELRAMAAAALVRCGDQRGLPILEGLLSGRRLFPRMITLTVLARLPVNGVESILQTVRSGSHPMAAAAANEILEML